MAASTDSDCMRLMQSAQFSHGAEGVPAAGTTLTLGRIEAAFHIGLMIRWLAFNDTWLAQEGDIHTGSRAYAPNAVAQPFSLIRTISGLLPLAGEEMRNRF